MIGRLLTKLELEIVFLHSERLLALGFPSNAAACLMDETFAAFPYDWQAVVLADMQFMQNDTDAQAGLFDANDTEVCP